MNTPFVHFKVRTLSHLYDNFSAKLVNSNCDANPLFLLGSGRNGSTLLASVLNNHNRIFIPAEQHLIPALLKYALLYPFASWQQLVDKACYLLAQPSQWHLDIQALRSRLNETPLQQQTPAYLLNSIYHYYGNIHHKSDFIWADKTPANTKFAQLFKAQFPKSKFIFLVRDPRDVVTSYFSINRNSKPLAFLLWRWQNTIRKYDFLKKAYPKDVRLLKYEDFVTQPALEIKQILHWLKLEPVANLTDRTTTYLPLLGVENVVHHANVRNAINTQSIGKWKNQLDPEVVQEINKKLKTLMKRMAYV